MSTTSTVEGSKKMLFAKRTPNSILICQVCGDHARGLNFEVMTCMSCKTFFRRHALKTKNFQCQLDGSCEINRLTRSGCLACRLKKCFSLGMNPQLIRAQPGKSSSLSASHSTSKLPLIVSKPLPRNLLRNDHSTLTANEWNLLSNILHAYDVHDAINHAKSLLDHQASLAPKLRSKSTITLDIVGYFYSITQSFVQRTPLFADLPVDARRALIQRNSDTIGAYNSIFLVRESNALDYSAYAIGCSNVYGQHNYTIMKHLITQLEPNGVFFKLMLLVLCFSGNCSLIIMENPAPVTNIVELVHVQHVLVTMFWKYLNYQYGFAGAVKSFNSLVKFVLNLIRWSSDRASTQHIDMVETMVEKTAQSLNIEDDSME